MIIIEGCDNTGKTTLGHRLVDDIHGVYVTNKQPRKRELMIPYMKEMFLLSAKMPLILDRWPAISEPIYGPILRGESALEEDAVVVANHILTWTNPLVIYCRPPLDKVLGSIDERDQLPGVVENAEKIYHQYDEAMWRFSQDYRPVLIYDYTRDLYPEILNHVKTHLQGAIQ